jgi:hypothetical protein
VLQNRPDQQPPYCKRQWSSARGWCHQAAVVLNAVGAYTSLLRGSVQMQEMPMQEVCLHHGRCDFGPAHRPSGCLVNSVHHQQCLLSAPQHDAVSFTEVLRCVSCRGSACCACSRMPSLMTDSCSTSCNTHELIWLSVKAPTKSQDLGAEGSWVLRCRCAMLSAAVSARVLTRD